jgi:hypothetical protein
MAKFVKPRVEKPIVLYKDDNVRVVKTRTQIQTGEWNKELIIELLTGSDALGSERWVELDGLLAKQLWKRAPHEMDWRLLKTLGMVISDEEDKDDYDYIFYINKGRYRVKGVPREDVE